MGAGQSGGDGEAGTETDACFVAGSAATSSGSGR